MNTSESELVVLASRVRHEEKRIMDALQRRGQRFEYLDPRTLFVTGGQDRHTGRFVLNREVGHFRAWYAADALEAAGATVVNSAAATHLSGDKWLTSAALLRHGLPTPRTALAITPDAAGAALAEIGYPAVIKPLVGSWGRLVTKVTDEAMAAAVLEFVAALPAPQSHVVYVQELVPKADRDIRVVVVGGRALGATWRKGEDWRTNVARGAVSERCPLSDDLAKLAVSAADAVGADIAGVDVIEDADGRLTVLEVNDRVEFRGFEAAHDDISVADAIADLLITKAER